MLPSSLSQDASLLLCLCLREEEGVQQLHRLRSVAFSGRSGLMVKVVFHH